MSVRLDNDERVPVNNEEMTKENICECGHEKWMHERGLGFDCKQEDCSCKKFKVMHKGDYSSNIKKIMQKGCGKSVKFLSRPDKHMYYCGNSKFQLCPNCKPKEWENHRERLGLKPKNHSQQESSKKSVALAKDSKYVVKPADTLSDKLITDRIGKTVFYLWDKDVKESIKRLKEDVLTEVHLYSMINKKAVVKIIDKIFGDKLT